MTLTAIINKQVIEKKKEDYQKYKDLYQITHKFIKEHEYLVYGGLAINLALPIAERFYADYELPDYDFFCPNSFKVAKNLADIYAANSYKYIEVKPGLHSGTYKVFVEFMPVADITDVPLALFNKMNDISKLEKSLILKNNPTIDLNIVPLDFLRMSTHLELSRPNGFIERWEKVFYRMQLLYSSYPILISQCEIFIPNPIFDKLIKSIKTFMKKRNVLYTGPEVVKYYLKLSGYISDMSNLDFISMNYKEDAEYIVAELLKIIDKTQYDIKLTHYSALNKSQILPQHYIIKLIDKTKSARKNTQYLCTVFESVSCYSYKTVSQVKYASIDTILSFLYAFLLSTRTYINYEKTKCIISHLQINKSNFELKCYGIQEQPNDIKKNRWDQGKRPLIYRPK